MRQHAPLVPSLSGLRGSATASKYRSGKGSSRGGSPKSPRSVNFSADGTRSQDEDAEDPEEERDHMYQLMLNVGNAIGTLKESLLKTSATSSPARSRVPSAPSSVAAASAKTGMDNEDLDRICEEFDLQT